ncbi:SDR family NAD(P)-dependent oxidoreductase [Comamonadaceae bacterium OH2545_COT-014]|nr:SDR family NAD(P)-dependent oxidoreductase [Comamonadaceae bacterium OH2545_COT-014]
MNTSGHKVLITGGASGIGLALAKRFHAAGNSVVLAGRRADALAEAARALPGAQTAVADITQPADRARLLQAHGDISILVNNAGIQINRPLLEQHQADIRHELETNLAAPVLLTHAFLPALLRQPQAAIVNVSSGLAIVPKEAASIYCASKAALHSFSQTLRWQLEGTPVQVFELLPPLVDTAMTQGRGKGKISADALAAEFWRAFVADRHEVLCGKTRLLALTQRLSPALAQRIMRKGL